MIIKAPDNIDCPVCYVKLGWNSLPAPNNFRGKCPNCGMGFTFMNGTIISDPKFS